jgi:hypothetical protein
VLRTTFFHSRVSDLPFRRSSHRFPLAPSWQMLLEASLMDAILGPNRRITDSRFCYQAAGGTDRRRPAKAPSEISSHTVP